MKENEIVTHELEITNLKMSMIENKNKIQNYQGDI